MSVSVTERVRRRVTVGVRVPVCVCGGVGVWKSLHAVPITGAATQRTRLAVGLLLLRHSDRRALSRLRPGGWRW